MGLYYKKSSIKIASSALHKVPSDLRELLLSNNDILEKWNSLTPIARNEWICWMTIFKKPETRKEHLIRIEKELLEGKKRPCCWAGCPHRNPNSKKWFK